MHGALLEDEVGKMRATVAKARFHIGEKNVIYKGMMRSEQPRNCAVESPLSALRKHWSIWRGTPATRICNRL